MNNKPHTEEAKRKMSKAQKGVKHPERCSENHPHWKGNSVSHSGVHGWVRRHKGKAKVCKYCKITDKEKRIEWANIDHKYRRNLDDYIPLCCKCHQKHDRKYNNYKIK